ncbi:MAG: esterase family protein [Prevotellaceae bacterium]|jgi:enterochelin esterase-like enzyme|nr:esterase family protein [Prevotellaceae bacterium]
MKKILLLILSVTLSVSAFAQQQHGRIFDDKIFKSSILGRDVNYTIYLPPDYETSSRKYPVLFLLHGYSDDHTGWMHYGEMNRIADELIGEGKISPMIIVVADAKKTWYINNYINTERFEDMYITEFIPHIEKTYRARQNKLGRAIGGLSMGGYGSLLYALKYTDMFSVCVAMSAAVFTDDELKARFTEGESYGYKELFGGTAENLSEHWHKNSIIDIVKNLPDDKKKSVKFYIDCGDDDFLYCGNSTLHIVMRDLKVDHEYRVRDGAHSWAYWRQCLYDGLIYINKCMRH